jgi:lactam utilization protein B
MDIRSQKVTAQGNELWLVKASSIQLHFNDQKSALDFCTRLKDRVDAPHELPAEAHKSWAERTELAPV